MSREFRIYQHLAPRMWPTRLFFNGPGCWEVTGRAGRSKLTFVLSMRAEP